MAAVGETDDHVVSAASESADGGVVANRDAGAGEGVVQRTGEGARGNHVAEGRLAVFFGAQQGAAEAALVGYVDGLDGGGRQLGPHAEAFEGQPGAVGQGQHTRVLARCAAGAGVHQQDVEARVLQGQRQRHAHRAGADDHEVMSLHPSAPPSRLRCRPRSWGWRW